MSGADESIKTQRFGTLNEYIFQCIDKSIVKQFLFKVL